MSSDQPDLEASNGLTAKQSDPAPEAGATRPDRWRRPRWIIAGLASLVLIVIAALLVPTAFAKSPEDVVADYLAALQEGDVETATTYTDHLGLGEADSVLLSEEAATGDWSIARLARSHPDDIDPAAVDVTIEAPDGRVSQGRFELVEESDGWTIRNPLVKVDLTMLPVGFVEFNGVVTESDTAWLFPGAYSAYESYGDLYRPDASSYVALPFGDSEEEYPEDAFIPLFTIEDALNDTANEQVRAWIDRCAESTEPSPKGCPFAAAAADENWRTDISVGSQRYYTEEVSWEVVEYPVVRLEQAEAGFTIRVMSPGEMTVSGTADGVDFSGSCGIGLTTGYDSPMVVRPDLDTPWPLEATPSFTCSSNRHPH